MANKRGTGSRRGRQRVRMFIAVFVVVVMALGVGLGFFLGARRPKTPDELFNEGRRAYNRGLYADAVGLYREGIEMSPNSVEGYVLLGAAHAAEFARAGDPAQRSAEIDAFRKAVELAPGNTEALLGLGRALVGAGEAGQGSAYLKKLLEIDPGHPDRASIEQLIQQAVQPAGP